MTSIDRVSACRSASWRRNDANRPDGRDGSSPAYGTRATSPFWLESCGLVSEGLSDIGLPSAVWYDTSPKPSGPGEVCVTHCNTSVPVVQWVRGGRSLGLPVSFRDRVWESGPGLPPRPYFKLKMGERYEKRIGIVPLPI